MHYSFLDTTLLVTHYNRSGSLERLLSTFEKLNCRFGAIVVSDDGSRPEHLEKVIDLQQRFPFKLVTTPVNRGLGNNINKGQEAVASPFTLYVQEDFLPTDIFPTHFQDALTFMREDTGLDIARFYSYFAYPQLIPFKKGFSKMVYSFWNLNHLKFYYYSDHPHLRRSNFLEKFGKYPEGYDINVTEAKMGIQFLRRKGRGIFFNEFSTLFEQRNTSHEPSTMDRPDWRLSPNPFVRLARFFYLRYRWLKHTIELHS